VYAAFINSNHAKEVDCFNQFFEDRWEELLSSYGFGSKIKYAVSIYCQNIEWQNWVLFGGCYRFNVFCRLSRQFLAGLPNCVDRLEALQQLEVRSKKLTALHYLN